jgi:hypothetical protein
MSFGGGVMRSKNVFAAILVAVLAAVCIAITGCSSSSSNELSTNPFADPYEEFLPEPPPSVEPRNAGPDCTPGYDPCLPDFGDDYDCFSGEGDGPFYTGRVYVQQGMDVYKLDRDASGEGCEAEAFWGPA